MPKRRKYDAAPALAALKNEREFAELVKAGCDAGELLRHLKVARLSVSKPKRLDRELLGLTISEMRDLAGRLALDADSIERFLRSPSASWILEHQGDLLQAPTSWKPIQSVPSVLRVLVAMFWQASDQLPGFVGRSSTLSDLAVQTLLAYVRNATGAPHHREIAALLGCEPDALKQAEAQFARSERGEKLAPFIERTLRPAQKRKDPEPK